MSFAKTKRFCLLIICFVLLSGFHWWDPVAKWMGIGNSAVETGDLETAQKAYSQAETHLPGNERILHNQALVNLQQDDPETAMAKLKQATGSNDPEVKTRALYNKGCLELQSGDVQAAADTFVDVLKLSPDDEDAKVNLEMALQMLQQMPTPSPQPQENQEQQNQDQENQEQQENQNQDQPPTPTPESSPSPQPEQENESGNAPTPTPQEQSSQDEQSQAGQETPKPVEEGKMSQMEAERLLDAQEEEEMEVLQRFHRLPEVDDREIEKDW